MLIVIRTEAGVLHVEASGTFSLKEAKRTFLNMLDVVALHKAKHVCFDGRKLLGSPHIMERFYYGEFAAQSVADYAELGLSRATKFAYVLKEPVLDPRRFGETTAVNRGMRVRAFDNPEDAFRWLGVKSVNKPDACSTK